MKWYKRVKSARGDAEAFYFTARIYLHDQKGRKSLFAQGVNQFKEAINRGEKALEKYSDEGEYQLYKGYLLFKENKYGEAIEYLEQAQAKGIKKAKEYYDLCRKRLNGR